MGLPIKVIEKGDARHVFDNKAEKAPWLKIRPPDTSKFNEVKAAILANKLHTVCQEARCPNMSECWSGSTFTFMVLGDTCTRACRFCNVKTAYPAAALDPHEPEKLAKVVAQFDMDYVVITSVDRDDLPDQGAGHFATCIAAIKKSRPQTLVEVLIPDFRGDEACLKKIIEARPDVIAHNIETVQRLTPKVRDPRAKYDQSLRVLDFVKKSMPHIYTKSSIIVGFGETDEEIIGALKDLRAVGVDIVTFGQYLRPTSWHVEVTEYIKPEKFAWYKKAAEELGFLYAASGPFVRSSYRAGEFFTKALIERRRQENGTIVPSEVAPNA